MRFNYKKIRGIGRSKRNERPISLGEISSDGKLHIYLGRNARNYRDMLKLYVQDYDTMDKQNRLMTKDTAVKLYRGGRTGKDIWFPASLASGLLGAGANYIESFSNPSERPYHFYNTIFWAYRDLKPIKLTRKQFDKYIKGSCDTITLLDKKSKGSPILFDLQKTVQIYNRFHSDKIKLGNRFLVLSRAFGKLPTKFNGTVQFYYVYDRNLKRYSASLNMAVNNFDWQMDRATADKVSKMLKIKANYDNPNKSGEISERQARSILLENTIRPYRVNADLIEKSKHDTVD